MASRTLNQSGQYAFQLDTSILLSHSENDTAKMPTSVLGDMNNTISVCYPAIISLE